VIEIEVNNSQSVCPLEVERLEHAVRAILAEEQVEAGVLSLAIVDDLSIHALNRRYLQHDYPTDVLSFVLEQRPGYLEGEVIVSAERAAALAPGLGWSAADELLLYVTHGVLHLVGYDDHSSVERQRMRARERHHLARFGLAPPHLDEPPTPSGAPSHAVRARLEGDSGT
jgi:probable rRNA maturation factor